MKEAESKSPTRQNRLHRPFILTSKAVKLAHKTSAIYAPNSPAPLHLHRSSGHKNNSQSYIRFEVVNQNLMENRADQLHNISIGERRRKKRQSVNCAAVNRSNVYCLPEQPPHRVVSPQIADDRQPIIGELQIVQLMDEYNDDFARLDREMKSKTPNIVNMYFCFTLKKSSINEKNFEAIKRKNKSVESRAVQQEALDQAYYYPSQPHQTSLINTIYEFKDLENARYTAGKERSLIRYEDRLKSSINRIQLSPIKKFTNYLTQYIQRQYLNIERLRPVAKTPSQSVGVTYTNIESQCHGILIRNLAIQEEAYKERRLKETSFHSRVQQRSAKYAPKEPIRTNSQDRKRNYKPNTADFTMTRRTFNKKDYFVFGMSDRAAPESINRIELYRDFLWKINYSNGLFVEPEVELEKNYKVYIGRGNNSMLIKGLMKRRFWWTIVDKPSASGEDAANFVFTQLKNNDYIKAQKHYARVAPYNNSRMYSSSMTLNTTVETSDNESTGQSSNRIHKKSHSQSKTSSKYSLVMKNKQKDKLKSATVEIVADAHINIFSEVDMSCWQAYFEKNQKIEQVINYRVYAKRATLLRNKAATKIETSDNLRVHNHFNANYFIGNKKALFYSMRKYYELNGTNVFDYLPLTFHISKGVDDPEYAKFFKHYTQLQENKGDGKQLKNIWIVKPGEFTNRGTGITVCSSLDDIKIRLKGRYRNQNGKYRTFIVQKYLERPLLYHRRKFDIRHYMMVSCINGSFKGYWYEDGYIRTTSYEYNIKNCKDNLVHLTNDAIQKNTYEYGKYEKGNKISYQDFQKYLDTYYKGNNFDFLNGILPQMKKICTDAIRASYFLLDPERRTHNFEIFGMDFMIDEEFKPWLIEINTNPCLELCCPLLSKIIPAMVENALKIGLDPLFPPPYNWPANKKYQLGDNPLETNKFILVFDEVTDGESIQYLYRNIDKVDKNMGDIEEEDEEYEDEGKYWNEDQ